MIYLFCSLGNHRFKTGRGQDSSRKVGADGSEVEPRSGEFS